MKKIFIILFCLLITSPAYAGTTPLFDLWKFFKKGKIVKSAKLIKIPSYNSGPFPNEFMSLKDGSYKNSPVKIDASCITYGYTIGGNKTAFRGMFKKFFKKNLLN